MAWQTGASEQAAANVFAIFKFASLRVCEIFTYRCLHGLTERKSPESRTFQCKMKALANIC